MKESSVVPEFREDSQFCQASVNIDLREGMARSGQEPGRQIAVKILIIGCGYLGHRAAQRWLKAGHSVTALTRSQQRSADWREQGIAPILGDVVDPASLTDLPQADLCLYSVGFDRSGAHEKRTVYVDGLRNVLQAVTRKIPRVLYISSTSVYGQDEGEWVNEDSLCEPTSEGGKICLVAEQELADWAKTTGSGHLVLRLSGLYGPGRMIDRLEQFRSRTPLPGNPDAWLNLIHVDDAARTVCRLSESPFPASLLLLSDECPLRRREFYSHLATLAATPPPIFNATEAAGLNKRCDSSRVRKLLGMKLEYPTAREGLEQILASTD